MINILSWTWIKRHTNKHSTVSFISGKRLYSEMAFFRLSGPGIANHSISKLYINRQIETQIEKHVQLTMLPETIIQLCETI